MTEKNSINAFYAPGQKVADGLNGLYNLEQLILNGIDDDPEDFGLCLGPCEFCGCSEFYPCEEGCSWSVTYILQGRAVCTACEQKMLTLRINLGALKLLRFNGGLFLTAGVDVQRDRLECEVAAWVSYGQSGKVEDSAVL